MSTASADPEPRPRRRVRIAQALLRRVQRQRDWFASTYAAANTPQQQFNDVASALRAAIGERRTRADPHLVERLNALNGELAQLLDELHEQQEQHAHRVLRSDQNRQNRNERRRRDRDDEQPAA